MWFENSGWLLHTSDTWPMFNRLFILILNSRHDIMTLVLLTIKAWRMDATLKYNGNKIVTLQESVQ